MTKRGKAAANRNPDVDRWFEAKSPPLTEVMQEARSIILLADERVNETIKWSTPTFAFRGNIASFNPSKKFVSLLFHRGAEIPGRHRRLIGDGKLVRTMRFASLSEVKAAGDDLTKVIRAWCDWKADA